MPRFVLEELYFKYKNAENSDDEELASGAINNFQMVYESDAGNSIFVADESRDRTKDVDVQLMDFAKRTSSVVFTNDSGVLAKAIKRGVKVSSLSDLAESMAEPYGIGEIFSVRIVRRGQKGVEGIGYLRDGSRVVIDNGAEFVNDEVDVKIDSVLKTNNGRIFFATICE